jgi:hypothetical protein
MIPCSETPRFRTEPITPVRISLQYRRRPSSVGAVCAGAGASDGDLVPQWLLLANPFFEAGPATVAFFFCSMAACAVVRTLVFVAASVVALAGTGQRAKRALTLAQLVAWRRSRPK